MFPAEGSWGLSCPAMEGAEKGICITISQKIGNLGARIASVDQIVAGQIFAQMVDFVLIACSFAFEAALQSAGTHCHVMGQGLDGKVAVRNDGQKPHSDTFLELRHSFTADDKLFQFQCVREFPLDVPCQFIHLSSFSANVILGCFAVT